MIANGTTEVLESITDYLDRKKDAQDGDYWFYIAKPPFDWALLPLRFPPPRLSNGTVTEEALCVWLTQIEDILARNERLEEERLDLLSGYDSVIRSPNWHCFKPGAVDGEPDPARDPVRALPEASADEELKPPRVYRDFFYPGPDVLEEDQWA